jgi:CheY-like chemotaxis protein/glycine cleavage system H lipoate-binding protein
MSKRVLVVDDAEVVLGSVRKALGKDDFLIDTTQSAVEALSLLGRTSYDLVITDLMMPEIDGLELLERIKGMGHDIPTVMITGYPTIQTALRAKRLGAFDYVSKPFTRQELRSVAIRAIRKGEYEPDRFRPPTAHPDRKTLYYIPDHSWTEIESNGTARIGLARSFAATVGEVASLQLPEEGHILEQGRTCALIRAADGVDHSLYSPLGGRVVEINPSVIEEASLAGIQPEGKGWLFRLEPRDPDREILHLVQAGPNPLA